MYFKYTGPVSIEPTTEPVNDILEDSMLYTTPPVEYIVPIRLVSVALVEVCSGTVVRLGQVRE